MTHLYASQHSKQLYPTMMYITKPSEWGGVLLIQQYCEKVPVLMTPGSDIVTAGLPIRKSIACILCVAHILNMFRTEQNCRHFANIFKFIFGIKIVLIQIFTAAYSKASISPQYIIVSVMSSRWTRGKILPERECPSLLTHICVVMHQSYDTLTNICCV